MLKPLPESRWGFAAAAHLLNRGGFGGSPAEIEALAAMGPDEAVRHLVDFETITDSTPDPEWARPDPDLASRLEQARQLQAMVRQAESDEERRRLEQKRREAQRMDQRQQRERIVALRAWWLGRMANGPRPLQEKLTLFWHGHFATSAQRVRDPYYMWRQNDIFRRHGAGEWITLLTEVSKDPAMLIWLDQAQSRRQRPNENFAREVMELFALGEGNYTERDVTEAARALTGWTLNRATQSFAFNRRGHDPGVKTILGKTGAWDGDDVLRIIVERPQSARFLSRKLWVFFANETPSPDMVEALAAVFRENNQEFRPLLRTLFRSEEFYAEDVVRTQIKSPVQWLVGSVRMLERGLPPTQLCNQILRNLGQELLYPPNVKGWDGGASWITTNTLLDRYNFAAQLAGLGRAGGANVERFLTTDEREDPEKLIAALERRFLQSSLKERQRQTLREFVRSRPRLTGEDIAQAIRLLMATPEYQLV